MSKKVTNAKPGSLRSQDWFNNPNKIDMVAFHLERLLANGWTLEDLQSGKPLIGIAQTGSDIAPCNRHHLELAKRVREGIREAGGIAFEFPIHPIQETLKRPTAALDRNLQYLSLVEILYGYPIDGVVLTTGCDKTTPAQIMAAATVDIPAIVLSGGPMLSGWYKGERVGAGTVVWKVREMLAWGEIDNEGHRPACRCPARQRRLGPDRLRHPAARQRDARRRVPGRGFPSRRWCPGGGGRADRQGKDPQAYSHSEWQVAGRQLQGALQLRSARDQEL